MSFETFKAFRERLFRMYGHRIDDDGVIYAGKTHGIFRKKLERYVVLFGERYPDAPFSVSGSGSDVYKVMITYVPLDTFRDIR